MLRNTYLNQIWEARYFWSHLAWADIRCKYRRSLLGLSWALLQPLCLTFLFSFVMSHVFHTPIEQYAPFIYSGLIFWEFIVSTIVTGCMTFVNAESYIKQFRHPLLIYTLRGVIPSMINLFCAFSGLFVWCMLINENINVLSLLSLLISFPLLFILAWASSTITAFIGVKFRDLSQLMIILLQAIYFISPILFLPTIFSSNGLSVLLTYNPIYYLLQLFRLPLLSGQFPPTTDFLIVMLACLILWLCVWWLVKRNETNVIFYL